MPEMPSSASTMSTRIPKLLLHRLAETLCRSVPESELDGEPLTSLDCVLEPRAARQTKRRP